MIYSRELCISFINRTLITVNQGLAFLHLEFQHLNNVLMTRNSSRAKNK